MFKIVELGVEMGDIQIREILGYFIIFLVLNYQ